MVSLDGNAFDAAQPRQLAFAPHCQNFGAGSGDAHAGADSAIGQLLLAQPRRMLAPSLPVEQVAAASAGMFGFTRERPQRMLQQLAPLLAIGAPSPAKFAQAAANHACGEPQLVADLALPPPGEILLRHPRHLGLAELCGVHRIFILVGGWGHTVTRSLPCFLFPLLGVFPCFLGTPPNPPWKRTHPVCYGMWLNHGGLGDVPRRCAG